MVGAWSFALELLVNMDSVAVGRFVSLSRLVDNEKVVFLICLIDNMIGRNSIECESNKVTSCQQCCALSR